MCRFLESDERQKFRHPLLYYFWRQPVIPSIHPEVFGDRKIRVKIVALGNDTHDPPPTPGPLADGTAIQQNFSAIQRCQSLDRTDRRTFPCPVGSQKGIAFARSNLKAESSKNRVSGIAFAQRTQFKPRQIHGREKLQLQPGHH